MCVVKPHHIMEFIKKCTGFDRALTKVKILEMKNGRGLAELKIDEEHLNPLGTLHGGLSATLVDVISSFGLATHENAKYGHVSVDMHLTYYKSATLGEEIQIVSETAKIGKKLAYLEVLIRKKKTGDILVKGTHVKFLLGG